MLGRDDCWCIWLPDLLSSCDLFCTYCCTLCTFCSSPCTLYSYSTSVLHCLKSKSTFNIWKFLTCILYCFQTSLDGVNPLEESTVWSGRFISKRRLMRGSHQTMNTLYLSLFLPGRTARNRTILFNLFLCCAGQDCNTEKSLFFLALRTPSTLEGGAHSPLLPCPSNTLF